MTVLPLTSGKIGDKPPECKDCSLEHDGKGFCWPEPKQPDWSRIKLAAIGEAPGKTEIQQQKPFVGKAGFWLERNILYPIGLNRWEVFFDNTLRCLPPKNKQGEFYPVGEAKKKAELHCRVYDTRIPPTVPTVLVGGKAAAARLGVPNITDWHGHIQVEADGSVVGCTFHPAAAMRQPNLLPVIIREIYNILAAHRNPRMLAHPTVLFGTGWYDTNAPLVFDLEWNDKERITCVGMSTSPSVAYSTYASNDSVEARALLKRLSSGQLVIGHNLIDADLRVLGRDPLSWSPKHVFDTMIAAHLIHPHFASLRLLGLQSLVSYYRPTTNWKNDKQNLLVYNGRDCAYNYYLYEQLVNDLTDTGQWHLMEKQQRLAWMAREMRCRGMRIDVEAVQQKHEGWGAGKQEWKEFFPFNPNSTKQVVEWFAQEGIKLPDAKKPTIKKHNKRHPLLEQLYEYKEFGVKPLTTWFPLDTDRIHPNFHVTGTDVARFSSSDPNVQNIPPKLRHLIVADEEQVLVSFDFSQIENRCIAWLAHDEKMLADFASGMDFHTLSASRIFNKRMEDVTPQERYEGKRTVHATNYGETAWNLAERLFGSRDKKSVNRAKWLQAAYFNAYPAIKQWQEQVSRHLETEDISLRNPFGRLRVVYAQDAHNRMKRGCHYLGCSTAAEVVNQRALDVYDAFGLMPLSIVHDELLYQLPIEGNRPNIREVLEQPVLELDGLVLPVTLKIGWNYGQMKEGDK